MTAVAFVPPGFEPPLGLAGPGFVLEPLGPEHNEADHAAWSSSMDHIRATPGFGDRDWPRAMTPAENRADLVGHARDFAERSGFTYTVLDPESRDVVGCVYIYPLRGEPGAAHVSWWVRANRAELDVPLHEAVAAWLERDWPFRRFEYAARSEVGDLPPVPVISEMVDVPAADGTADAFLTRPDDGGPHPAVVLFPDAFGIRTALRAHAERLAAAGYCVLLPNVLYRDGRSPVVENVDEAVRARDRSASFAVLTPKMDALTPERSQEDGAAWLAFLDGRAEARPGRIGVVGYCMGGRQALRLAGDFPDSVAAAASFHGGNLATERGDSPHLTAVHAAAELYVGHADNDATMDPEQMGRLARALGEAHVRHTTELYAGARHGWTQADNPVYDEPAAERHWVRLLELFGRVLLA